LILVLSWAIINAIILFIVKNIIPKLYAHDPNVLLIINNTWLWFVLYTMSVALRRVI